MRILLLVLYTDRDVNVLVLKIAVYYVLVICPCEKNNELCVIYILHHTIYSIVYYTDFRSTTVSGYYWTDLRDTSRTVPGVWEWGDGTELSYQKWLTNQPNNANDDRGAMHKFNSLFNDGSPSFPAHCICEKEI